MEPEHRRLISTNSDRLAELINLNKLKPHLQQTKIFTSAMLEDIYSISIETEFARKKFFLEEIQTRGPDAFSKFLEVLNNAGFREAVELLKPGYSVPSKIHRESPERENFRNAFESNSVGGSRAENAPDSRVTPATEWKRGDYIYKMTSKPRGYCLIINNVNFDDPDKKRDGSDVDAMRLDEVFRQLGYDVYVRNDRTTEEMVNLLLEFSTKEDHKFVDSCVVILLTHGSKDGVCGTNEKYVPLNDIIKMFDNDNCPLLKGKPKMFFIQACRGENFDIGVPGIDSYDSAVQNVSPSVKQYRLPTCTDMLISYATIEGHCAIRNSVSGSWFCNHLTCILIKMAHNTDLVTMLDYVSAGVKKMIAGDGEKQATELVLKGWDKRLYFNPGLS